MTPETRRKIKLWSACGKRNRYKRYPAYIVVLKAWKKLQRETPMSIKNLEKYPKSYNEFYKQNIERIKEAQREVYIRAG